MIKFSFIVPVFQAELYLERLINSILAQDYRGYELILVDDGSSDSSGKICDEFSGKYSQIRTIHKKNGGVSSARNEGIKNAKGEYIIFGDADDYYDENYLNDIILILNNDPQDICVCGYYLETNSSTERILSQLNGTYDRESLSNMVVAFLKGSSFNPVWNKVFRTDIIKMNQIEFPKQKIAEDGMFVCQYLQKAKKFYFINKAYYHYCQNEESAVHKFCKTRWQDENNYLKEMKNCAEVLTPLQTNIIMGTKYRNAVLFDLYNLLESPESIATCAKILKYHLQSLYNLIDWNLVTSDKMLQLQVQLLRRYRTFELIALMRFRKKLKRLKKTK